MIYCNMQQQRQNKELQIATNMMNNGKRSAMQKNLNFVYLWHQYGHMRNLSLCSLMIAVSKDIRRHVWPYSILCLQITKSDIRPRVK